MQYISQNEDSNEYIAYHTCNNERNILARMKTVMSILHITLVIMNILAIY